jgi:hypothetical protein
LGNVHRYLDAALDEVANHNGNDMADVVEDDDYDTDGGSDDSAATIPYDPQWVFQIRE